MYNRAALLLNSLVNALVDRVGHRCPVLSVARERGTGNPVDAASATNRAALQHCLVFERCFGVEVEDCTIKESIRPQNQRASGRGDGCDVAHGPLDLG